MMKKAMFLTTAISGFLTAVFVILVFSGLRWAIPYAITFATCLYHFAMRLLVGHSLNRIMGNQADYRKRWYQLRPIENRLYKLFKVKKWKGNMPTYDPSCFDPELHSWDEIAQAMCQAEIVHEVIAVLSFLPLFAAIPFGAFVVFFITSFLAALYDLSFVIIQRYNRPRIIRFIGKERTAK